MSEQHESCETCRFWCAVSENVKARRYGGLCMRWPPVFHPGSIDSDELREWTVYPPTERDDWCGEYERREEQER